MVFAQFLIVKPSEWWRPARLSCKTIKSSRRSIGEFDGYRWKLLYFGFFYVLLLALSWVSRKVGNFLSHFCLWFIFFLAAPLAQKLRQISTKFYWFLWRSRCLSRLTVRTFFNSEIFIALSPHRSFGNYFILLNVSEDLTCDSSSDSNTLRLIETFSCACSMPLATFWVPLKVAPSND